MKLGTQFNSFGRSLVTRFVAAPVFLCLTIGAVSPAAGEELTPFDKQISLDLQDTDFDNFVRIVSEVSNYNIIILDPISDKITLRILDTPWNKAFDSVLKTKGLAKLVDGNVIRVFRAERLAKMIRRQPGAYTGRLISLDLQDTDVDNALRIIEEVSNKKISRSPSDIANRKITMRAIDVPWDQCLDLIIESAGLNLSRFEDGYLVAAVK